MIVVKGDPVGKNPAYSVPALRGCEINGCEATACIAMGTPLTKPTHPPTHLYLMVENRHQEDGERKSLPHMNKTENQWLTTWSHTGG